MRGALLRLLMGAVLLLLPWSAWANLTDQQYATLQNDILVVHQAEFAAAVAANDDAAIAAAYNLQATPTFLVWRTSLTDQSIYEVTTSDGTVWSWDTYGQQPEAQRDSWKTSFRPGVVNPSLPQTRAGWAAIFKGGGAAATQLTHLLTMGRRQALRIEALLVVSGSGNGSIATPSVMGYEGTLRPIDVAHALRNVPLP